ncbi:glycoside hydrolase family 13 protein [Suillus decipiens]|nr:glycoside hydrolase family 13 protein [Suillus decipiens]
MAKTSKEVDRAVAQKQVPSLPQLKQTVSSTSYALQTLDDNAVTPKTPADEGKEFFLSARSKDERPICVYELRLDPDGGPNKDRSYIRLPPAYIPYILRVSLDAGTPASKNGIFKTNFPLDGGVFERNKFVERELPSDFSKPIQVDLPISHAGAFKYWVEYDGEVAGERAKGREGYFNIDPILRTKARSPILSSDLKPLTPAQGGAVLSPEIVYLPLDGLAILTVVSKWMGPISNWREHFTEAGDRGYTMLHWTPLQERGSSNSPYSIKDQKRYDPSIFTGSVNPGTIDARVKETLHVAKEEYGLLNLTDVVLNHTASDSPWLVDHPEAGYSPANTPHLTPAFELDTAILEFSSSLASKSLPTQVRSESDIDVLMTSLAESIKARNMWQYYVLDVEREKEVVKDAINSEKIVPWSGPNVAGKSIVALAEIVKTSSVVVGLNELGLRYGARSNGEMAAGFLKAASVDVVNNVDTLVEMWGRVVDVINVPLYEEWEKDMKIALEHVKNRLTYIRLEENGPKLGEISASCPLVEPYFTRLAPPGPFDQGKYSLANNGWIWDADPLQNFALSPSKAYLRREVIVWSDCVKLRYGSGPADNPWLWEHMMSYVRMLAATFDGFRIDNCHSTPMHVGVAMLDAARIVNPDLYVCAELFTGSEDMDLVFVQRLGINSLVREAGNAYDPKEFSRIMYRYGLGKPLGSMDGACLTNMEVLDPPFGKGPTRPCIVSPLNGSVPHALMYDLTHDNESYLDKRSAEHALSVAGIVTFGYCAIASVKGFDDLYPKLLNLVEENRQYELTQLGENSGIARAKRLLNGLHREMVLGGFEEGHYWQEGDYILVQRMHPTTQRGYLLIAHTAFSKGSKDRGIVNTIELSRTRARFVYGASTEFSSYKTSYDPNTIRGLPGKLVEIPDIVVPQISHDVAPFCRITVPDYFPPGSILIFEVEVQNLDNELDTFCASDADKAFGNLDLVDLNVVLYRADGEERDATNGVIGAYEVPGFVKLTYCGLEGWMHPLRHIMKSNDLGHPLCENFRQGLWGLDYIYSRLQKQTIQFPKLMQPAQWFKERTERIKASVPSYLRPKYFAILISTAYKAARRAAIEQCSEFVYTGHDFTQNLAMCAIQMHGMIQSASLDPEKSTPSLAAGLPHFGTGWARCWGRDVFISLRGLFLTTGNFEGAKKHILAFASTLKHGLIPNLLDSLRKPRYNSRDSPWWMLQNIQDYVTSAPDGLSILSEPVKRRFPIDDTWVAWDDARAYAYTSTLAEIIQEILQRHASGIAFREHNAGPNLDMQMKDEGFDIHIRVDWETGFIFGGNQHNCGTWMDKMGESEKAGTKGIPGTPRDGAPVEITGLLKSTLRWLDTLSSFGTFPFKGVEATINGQNTFVTYKAWGDIIQQSFERCYYIPLNAGDDSRYDVNPAIINRRGIYKDVYGSGPGREWSDYQFRPNFPIAMTVAPELFHTQHALDALHLADQVLRSPLGMKTLDPSDMQYRPHYDNSNDTTDQRVAKGLNYHNGPEWGWPLGYFLRAYLYFDTRFGAGKDDTTQTLHYLHKILLAPKHHIQTDPWAGIPELTNKNGQYCADSCNTQAWSASTLLDFLEEVHKMASCK